MNNKDYPYQDETYEIIGCCMEVHRQLGCGFLEAVYQEALEIEFKNEAIPYIKEAELLISYKGHTLNKKYKADFICFDNIILELKAISELNSQSHAQLINYLHATGNQIGLLINFGSSKLEFKRIIN